MPEPATTADPLHEPAGPERRTRPRPWTRVLKALGGLLMLASILVVLLGSWAISSSVELVLLCTLAWIAGFTLFVVARSCE